MANGEQLIGKTGLVYERYLASYPSLVHRFGIFTFPHQPVFTDCEGGCGRKEQRIIENQKNFAYSAIEEIVDVIPISIPEHAVYAYRLKEVKGGINDTITLIEYVLMNHFNTTWDKNLWEENLDITKLDIGTYERLLTLLFFGRVCCHLEKEEEYAWVREYYERVKKEHMERMVGKLES